MSYPGLGAASYLTELNDKTAAELPDSGKGKSGKPAVQVRFAYWSPDWPRSAQHEQPPHPSMDISLLYLE